MSDESIVSALFLRDEGVLSEISGQYGHYLSKIALNILNDPEDAEECVNDAYLKIWNSIPPNKPQNFKAYIVKIVRNSALNKYKEKSRAKRIPSELLCSLEELEECLPDISCTAESFERKRLMSEINIFVNKLSKRQRYIFVCRYYCNDSVKDIAASLKLSESMVFHELSNIRKHLKKVLLKEDLWYEN